LQFFIIFEAISKFGKTDVTATLMILGSSVSIIGKIILSSYMLTVGKRTSNQPLLASAKDYFGDILASAAVLFGGLLIRVTQKSYFDSIASFVVAVAIIYMGFDILKPVTAEIMETSDEKLVEDIKKIVDSFEYVCNPHQIRVRKLGFYYFIDLHVEVPPDMSVGESHKIATEIEKRIKERVKDIHEVIIHIEPCEKGSS